jgi:hypothetical protein
MEAGERGRGGGEGGRGGVEGVVYEVEAEEASIGKQSMDR